MMVSPLARTLASFLALGHHTLRPVPRRANAAAHYLAHYGQLHNCLSIIPSYDSLPGIVKGSVRTDIATLYIGYDFTAVCYKTLLPVSLYDTYSHDTIYTCLLFLIHILLVHVAAFNHSFLIFVWNEDIRQS